MEAFLEVSGVILGLAVVFRCVNLALRSATSTVGAFTRFRRAFLDARVETRTEGWGGRNSQDCNATRIATDAMSSPELAADRDPSEH